MTFKNKYIILIYTFNNLRILSQSLSAVKIMQTNAADFTTSIKKKK